MIAARRPVHVVLPLLLVLGGTLILLVNLGTLPQDAGWRLLELWPVVLVMVGIQMLVPHLLQGAAVPIVTVVLVGAIALAAFGYALSGPPFGAGTYTRFSSSSPVAGLSTGTLTIDAAGAQVRITARDLGGDLYQANIDYAASAPRFSYFGGDVHITSGANSNVFDWARRHDIMDVALSQSVAWSIVVNGAGTNTTVDLSAGTLRSVRFNGVGGNLTLAAPAPRGTVDVNVDGVGTTLTLKVPASVEYRVSVDGIGTSVSGVARTPGWTNATDRYDVRVDGVGAHVTVTTL